MSKDIGIYIKDFAKHTIKAMVESIVETEQEHDLEPTTEFFFDGELKDGRVIKFYMGQDEQEKKHEGKTKMSIVPQPES